MLSVKLTKVPFLIAHIFSILTAPFFALFYLVSTAAAQDVCERNPQVTRAIVESLSQIDDCSDVTEDHLLTILYLNLSHKGLDTLQLQDFRGLSRLVDIDLEHNTLETFPVGLFANLERIEVIRLGNNRLSDIPANSFSELRNLRLLKINNNSLHTLSGDNFSYLPSMYELDIRGNPIEDVSDSILGKMPNLNSLVLDNESIPKINPYVFGHVAFLRMSAPQSSLRVKGAYLAPQSDAGGRAAVFTRRSSRLFAVQNQYPPRGFGAYGILAFPSSITTSSESRYKAICEGFVSTILPSLELVKEPMSISESNQFPTIWPLRTSNLANSLNSNFSVDLSLCEEIVRDIDATMSAVALDRARTQSQSRGGSSDSALDGDGPYLLAWAPGFDFESAGDDVLILQFDLSDVRNSQQAERVFRFWTEEIEKDPGTWDQGFNFERIRLKLMLGADKYGEMIVSVAKMFFGAG